VSETQRFRRAVLAHRAFPEREREELAAHVGHHAMAGGVQGIVAEEFGRRHELARRLGAMRPYLDFEPPARILGRVEEPDVGATLVHDAPAIGRRVARVVVVVVGMAAQLAAAGSAGVEVADTLVIGEKPDTVAEPHRAGDVSLQHLETAKLTAATRVDPERSGGAAAIALPARRVGGIAADDLGAFRTEGEMVHLPVRKKRGQAAVDGQRKCAVVAEEGLPPGGDEEDRALRRPAAHDDVRPEPGHAARRAALGRHQIDLRMLLVACDIGEPAAIG